MTGEVYLRSTEGNGPPIPLNALVSTDLEPIYTFDASEPEAVYVGLGDDEIPVLLSRLRSGEISELTLSVDYLSAIDVPRMAAGTSAFLYTLEPNGTYERLDQGYGYEYGL